MATKKNEDLTPKTPIEDFFPGDGKDGAHINNHQTSLEEINVDLIERDPNQPRRHFDEKLISELAESIRQFGLIQNIAVRKSTDGKYIVVDGERRFRAWNILRKKYPGVYDIIPVMVVDTNDNDTAKTLSLIANVKREDLLPIERAEALKEYADRIIPAFETARRGKKKIKQEDIADILKLDRTTVSKLLTLTKLDPAIKDVVRHSPLYSLRALASIAPKKDPDLQKKLFNQLQKKLRVPLTDFGDITKQVQGAIEDDEKETKKSTLLFSRLKADFVSVNKQTEQNFKKNEAKVADAVLASLECLEKLATISNEFSLDISKSISLAEVKEQLKKLVQANQKDQQDNQKEEKSGISLFE